MAVDCLKNFGCAVNFTVKSLPNSSEFVPQTDENYLFDPTTTSAILAGFAFNQRVLVQGMHGTGKSTHIEQVASRLNWPLLRIKAKTDESMRLAYTGLRGELEHLKILCCTKNNL